MITHRRDDLLGDRLFQWRAETNTERYRLFWEENFPKLWKQSFRENRPGATLLLWRNKPHSIPFPSNGLSLWIHALAEDESFARKWEAVDQREWLLEMLSAQQKLTKKDWSTFAETSMHALTVPDWSTDALLGKGTIPFYAQLWLRGVTAPIRATEFIKLRTEKTYHSAHAAWQVFSDFRQALTAPQPPAAKKNMLEAMKTAIQEGEFYHRDTNPCIQVLAAVVEAREAHSDPYWAELFEQILVYKLNSIRQMENFKAVFEARMPENPFGSFCISTSTAAAVGRHLASQLSDPAILSTDPTNSLDRSTKVSELILRQECWNLVSQCGLVSTEADQAFNQALTIQVPYLATLLGELIEKHPRKSLIRMHSHAKADQMNQEMPAAIFAPAQKGPRF